MAYTKPYLTLLYYKYISIPDADILAKRHLKFCKSLDLTGRILIGDEGINGTVSGTVKSCEAYMKEVSQDDLFKGIAWKIDEVDELSFIKMHVRYRPEIVTFGTEKIDPNISTAPHLTAEEVLSMKEEEDVVMLDVRNTVEHEVGKFKDAITLDIDTFRDFPDKIVELESYKDKKIIAYCTGGIRCEKATAYLMKNGFENIYQIDGGIFKYARETGGKDFDGKMYVFDNRITVDVNSVNPTLISNCHNCEKDESRMINCANPECNKHIIQCEDCGWETDGCCSDECKSHPRKRKYDGKGFYVKGGSAEMDSLEG